VNYDEQKREASSVFDESWTKRGLYSFLNGVMQCCHGYKIGSTLSRVESSDLKKGHMVLR